MIWLKNCWVDVKQQSLTPSNTKGANSELRSIDLIIVIRTVTHNLLNNISPELELKLVTSIKVTLMLTCCKWPV